MSAVILVSTQKACVCKYRYVTVGLVSMGASGTSAPDAQALSPTNTTLPYVRGCIMMTWFLHLDQGLCSSPTKVSGFILVDRICSVE